MYIKKRGKAAAAHAKSKEAAAAANAKGGDGGDGHPAAAGGGGGGGGVMQLEDEFDHRLGNYQLMEAIGKGGYGTVYRGLNIERGMTVAVKRVGLQGIPHEELEGIEMEIRLLQNLDHPNIVKYLDSIRSDDYLNIILEYVENGSLSSLLGKFQGNFPEQLCSHYITQVLKGLQYLHTQGVIHRDIKGANILSTKEGQVKLADFGVATKLNESRKSDSVVGTPYWMAPEIIEMTGQQSSACDIWSVGCTCVELLTGKPPYFDLQQMPALFRIVQDEHPPLPDNISPALEDFLLQCFSEDTQLLACEAGTFKWMQVDELLAHQQSSKAPLLLASYHAEADTLEYFPLTAPIIVRTGEHSMLDLSSSDSAHVSLSVTNDHTMYARLGRIDEDSGEQCWEHDAVPKAFRKLPASELRGEADHQRRLVKMLAHASCGAVLPEAMAGESLASIVAPLGLHTPDECSAFVELYGFWLLAGSLSSAALTFTPSTPAAHDALLSILARLSLTTGSGDFTSSHALADSCARIDILHPEWISFFAQHHAALDSPHACTHADAALQVDQPTQLLKSSPVPATLAPWVLRSLTPTLLRSFLQGAVSASGCSTPDGGEIVTASPSLRDDLLLACLHAGFSAHFQLLDSATSSTPPRWRLSFTTGAAAEPLLLAHRDIRPRAFTGRVWCVTLPPHHLVFVRRVQESAADGTVLAASRPWVTGQCFQKDPNRRIDAHGLLKHPWLKRSVENLENLEAKALALSAPAASRGGAQAAATNAPAKGGDESDGSEWDEEDAPVRAKMKLPGNAAKTPAGKPSAKTGSSDLDEDWDADAASNHLKKPGHQSHALSTASFPQDMAPAGKKGGAGNNKSSSQQKKPRASVADSDADLVIKLRAPSSADDDRDPFADFSDDDDGAKEDDEAEDVVSKTSMKTIRPTPVITPAQLVKSTDSKANGGGGKNQALNNSTMPLNASSNSSISNTASSSASFGVGPSGASGAGLSHTLPSTRKLEAFAEDDDEEMEDFEELDDGADFELKAPVANSTAGASASAADAKGKAATAAAAAAAAADDFPDDEVDPFDDITFEEADDKADDVQLNRQFMRVLDLLSPSASERQVLDACDRLNELGKSNPEQVRSLMTAHGVIPIMEMLEVGNTHILVAILRVVNQIVAGKKDPKFAQNMSLVGLIPAIIRFGGANYPREIRMEAANFVRQFCYASDWTRKMFIACDGLPVLVSFLLEEYESSKTLVWNAVDCIRHVFDITTNPKNDFCRLFCKFGLLAPLTKQLLSIHADKESFDAPQFVLKIAAILHLFSQGDKVVKLHFAKPAVLESMLRVLPTLPQDALILLLKAIRNISMDSTTLDLLESAGAIPALVPFLDAQAVSENQHQALLSMYYLCQIKASRQEQAALSGIIPSLMRFVREEHPLKQFAYPIIFLLAKTSKRTRLELKKYSGLQFYVDILPSSDVYWRSAALDAISVWLADDTARVSFQLNDPSNINKLIRVFKETDDATQFDKMLPSFRKILATSVKVNQSLGRSKAFVREVRDRLVRHASSNNIRINLLKMISLLFAAQSDPRALAEAADLTPVLHQLLQDKAAVIVISLTHKLLEKLDQKGQHADATPTEVHSPGSA